MFVTDSGGFIVETAYPGSKQNLICMVKTRYPAGAGNHRNNAALLAAAPALYEALSDLLEAVESLIENTPELDTPPFAPSLVARAHAALIQAD
jgi:hypothetical protein